MNTQKQSEVSLQHSLTGNNKSIFGNVSVGYGLNSLSGPAAGVSKKSQKLIEEKDKKIIELEREKAGTQESLIEFYFHLNPGIQPTEQDREKNRLLKQSTYIVVDYVRGLVHKIEREIDDLKHKMQKKDPFYPMNQPEQNINEFLRQTTKTMQDSDMQQSQPQPYTGVLSNDIAIDKDDFFLQMRQKVDALKSEKRRLTTEIERMVKENLEINKQKQKIIETTKTIIDDIKASNDNLMEMLNLKQNEIDSLKKDLADRNIQVTKLKEKVSEHQKLQEKLRIVEHKYVMDITSEKQSHEKELKSMNQEIRNKFKYAVQVAQYEEKIKFLEQEMLSYKEKIRALLGKDSDIGKMSDQIDKLGAEATGFRKQCQILKMKLDNKKKALEYVRKENEKLFDQMKEMQKKTSIHKETASHKLDKVGLQKEVEVNPSLLKQYRKMIEEKDVIIKEMTKKFKKMNMNDKHLYVKHQQLESSKQEYEKLIRQHKQKQVNPPINLDDSVSESSIDEYIGNSSIFNKANSPKKSKSKHQELKSPTPQDESSQQFYTVKSMDQLYKDNLPALNSQQNLNYFSPKNQSIATTKEQTNSLTQQLMTSGQRAAAQYMVKNGVNSQSMMTLLANSTNNQNGGSKRGSKGSEFLKKSIALENQNNQASQFFGQRNLSQVNKL
eukprot:403373401